MKKVIYLSLATILASCGAPEATSEKKDGAEKMNEEIVNPYVTFAGKINNVTSGDVVIVNRNGYSKTITVDANGAFSDTLLLDGESADYSFSYGAENAPLFLKNGYNLNLTLDTDQFDETLKYTGNGEAENNFLINKYLREEQEVDFMGLIDPSNEDFDADLTLEYDAMLSYLENTAGLDAELVSAQKEQYESFKEQATSYHTDAIAKAAILSELTDKPSPDFTGFSTPDGGTLSLADLTATGKYTYIDVWATWCGPCKAEVPFIKEMIANYEGKNIQVVSLSVDEEDAKDKWIKMIAEKELSWQQIRADKAWESDFIQAFAINSIPRFILLDPNGVVVDPDAPRPSSEKLTELLESLKI
jgi:thiol-disulfide isomerase/thioredoxin